MAPSVFSLLFFLLLTPALSHQPKTSQTWSLLQLQRLLGNPPALSLLTSTINPCSLNPSPSLTVVCYQNEVTQLQISGNSTPLSLSFSLDSFFTTLTRLPNLKVLSLTHLSLFGVLPGHKLARLSSLEILNLRSNSLSGPLPPELFSLSSLQSLILDHNQFSGEIPPDLGQLPFLAVLSIKNNSLSGKLPVSLSRINSLRVLDLSKNGFFGELPDLSGLSNLQRLDLGENQFGPNFPELGSKISSLVLSQNSFTGGLPASISSYNLLQNLNISHNRFVGPLPTSILSLPSIKSIDISGNKFTGTLSPNLSCNGGLEFVDLSFNLLTGSAPECVLRNSSYMMNCLSNGGQRQNPYVFCRNQALAVGVIPKRSKGHSSQKIAIVVGAAAMAVAIFLLLFAFFVMKKLKNRKAKVKPPRRLVEHASNGYSSKLLSDAWYISETIKLGALGIPSYRSFSPEELEEAKNSIESSDFLNDISLGEMYQGMLHDKSMVAIRCLKLKRSQNLTKYIELFSKLRHQNLISALGHCFEYSLDGSSINRVFLVFEHVSNGTLRSHLCEGMDGQKLSWSQRISAIIGVAKGIQFLHAGIIPGLFSNGIKTTNVILDHNLVAKICSYDLPVLKEKMQIEMGYGGCSRGSLGRTKDGAKNDVYDFGVILLEALSGGPVNSENDVNMLKDKMDELPEMVNDIPDDVASSDWWRGCCKKSIKTVTELCFRCLSSEPLDRPSIEDILWNLQFAAQVEESWRGEAHSGTDSPTTAQSPLPI